jgi:ATP-dependent protease Clp ATPase subunit
MEPEQKPKGIYCCSFCGKNNKEANILVSGPRVYICDRCIELCVNIIRDDHPDFCKKDWVAGQPYDVKKETPNEP